MMDSIETCKISLSPGIEDSIYIDTSKYNVLNRVENTSYYLFKDSIANDSRFTPQYYLFSSYDIVCISYSVLATTQYS